MTGYTYRQEIYDVQNNRYYIVGKTDDKNILHVTPAGGHGGGMNFCIKHQIAYPIQSNCEGCRLDVLAVPAG